MSDLQALRSVARWVAAAVMIALLSATVIGVVALEPFGLETGWLAERSALVAFAIAIAAILAWWAARRTLSAGWMQAIAMGAALGLAWVPVFLLTGVGATALDAVIRGSANVVDGATGALVWALFAVGVIGLFLAVVAAPIGIVWGFLTRLAANALHLEPATNGGSRPALVALVGVAIVGGVTMAASTQPAEARCLDLGGYPTDAAFSPDGRLLAVTTQRDPNQPGEVVLLEWPSAAEVGRWSAWVDQSVAVDDDGRVYWSAWILGLGEVADGQATGDGVYSVRASESPHMIATGLEPSINDLTWTTAGLVGTSPNSHDFVIVPDGSDRIEPWGEQPREEVGAFWAAPMVSPRRGPKGGVRRP